MVFDIYIVVRAMYYSIIRLVGNKKASYVNVRGATSYMLKTATEKHLC